MVPYPCCVLDFDRLKGFSNEFDDEFPVRPEEGNRAYFGRDVLRGLVHGIEDFIHQRHPWGPPQVARPGHARLGDVHGRSGTH
ncbi:MAG: hypothetical protein ACREX3_04200 [Gammaproteobacteria bacterium]